MTEIIYITEMKIPMRELTDKKEKKIEMITIEVIEIAEMKEVMKKEDMDMEEEVVAGAADQETDFEDTARRLLAK